MKRITMMTVWLAMASLSSLGQQRWTMDQCVAYAVTHATEVQLQQVETERRTADSRLAMLGLLPTVQAQVSGQYSWGRNIDPETNTYNNVTTFNNYYQLYASLPIFDGGQTLRAFRQARLSKANSATAMQKVREEKAIDVMSKYVEAVYAERSIGLAAEKLADSQALLYKTRRMYELGVKSRPDVAQMESQVAEDDYNLLHQRHTARLAMLTLKQAMNFPATDSMSLDTIINTPLLSEAPVQATVTAYEQWAPSVKNADYTVKNARMTWLSQRAELWPSLYLNAGVSTNYYKNLSQTGGFQSFGPQFKNNLGEYVAVTLSLPLFVPSMMRSARRAKAAYQTAVVEAAATRRKVADGVTQAIYDRDGYAREVVSMERKLQSDSLAYHLSRRKYEEGMLSTFDLHTAAQTLIESRIRLLQMRMMLVMKDKLVNYYKGMPLWTLK